MTEWRQVNAVFEQALALAENQRGPFLEATCADDPALDRAVCALLHADQSAGCFLEDIEANHRPRPPARGGPRETGLRQETGLHPETGPRQEAGPRQIGPYQLLRPIGQGGMSTVYLARRSDGFKRDVALKLIRRDMESAEAERRLKTEREILAHLNHPGIAHLFDGGTTEEGLPYFVMEHIEGTSIDDFCDHQELTVKDRLQLFMKILEAVDYAHQNLIVHRDIKPSNILVTGDGEPKLLDFGISKVLNARMIAGEGSEATATWMRVLTPNYASPEQISGGTITTASDVYGLGVLLFKLLTGSLPHRLAGSTPREVETALREVTPPRPSDVVVAPGAEDSANVLAHARRTTPKQLSALLRGDLDAIIAQAIQPSPSRRYRSVQQLAEDVRRHLEGRPVLASPDRFLYRVGKLLRRHAQFVAGGALLAATLALLIGLLVTQNRRLAEERNLVAQERDATAQVLAFTERLLGLADPSVAQGREWTVAEALRQSDALIASELPDSPQIQSRLHGTVGRIFRGLGDSSAAVNHLEQALEIRRQLEGNGSAPSAHAASDLAAALVGTGDFARAESLALEAVNVFRETSNWHDPASVKALNTYVFALCADGDFARADEASEEALTHARSLLDERDPELAQAMHNRAHVLNQRADFEAAETLYRAVLNLREVVFEEPHPKIASTLVNLAANLDRQGEHAEAKALYQRALALQRRLYGDRHPDLAPTLNNLAVLHQELGQWAKAEASYREVIDLFPEGDIQHFRFRTELASLLDRTDRAEEAQALLRRELGYWRTKLPPGNTLVAWAENTLGAVLTGQGELDEATVLLERSLPLIRERRGPDDAYTQKAARRLARLQEAVAAATSGLGSKAH